MRAEDLGRRFSLVLGLILVVAEMLLMMSRFVTNVQAQSTWNIERVDFTGFVGWQSSLALSIYPHIAYYVATNGDLRYASWNGSAWKIETVDSEGKVGYDLSLALDSSDNPHISYVGNGDLRYASWNGSAWKIENVDSGSVSCTSLALDSMDRPHISYLNSGLRYASWNGSAWKIEIVYTSYTELISGGTSLALDSDDNPHISYVRIVRDAISQTYFLRYTKKTGPAWSFEDIDSNKYGGLTPCLALDSNDRPHISYLNGSSLRYASWNGSAWNIETPATAGYVWYPSLALDSLDRPHISYADYKTYSIGIKSWDLVHFWWTGSFWAGQTVDNVEEDIGSHSSIAIDSANFAHISCYGDTFQDLKYAEEGFQGWSIESVEKSARVGMYSSLALGSFNRPCISYYDGTNGDLKYAKWNGSSWNIEIVDSKGDVGAYSSLALDSMNKPHISYYDSTHSDLRYASWNGSAWNIKTVDSGGEVGRYTSLDLDSDDNPHISYYDSTHSDLRYASWNGSAWNIKTVDPNEAGEGSSLALDSNDNPHISYRGYATLKYASWNSSAWNIETADAADIYSVCTSLALDSSDRPHISYYGSWPNANLKYASWNSSAWNIAIVDSVGQYGEYCSLALDSDGNPHISYFDWTNYDLKYAQWNGSSWIKEAVDSTDLVGRYSSLALDSMNKPHISYHDWTNYDLKYATNAPTDPTPPTTVHDYNSLWHTEDFTITLAATDDMSGVAETYYRINDGSIQNVTANGQPLMTTEGANNKLEYWSVDNAGNEELPHKVLTGIKLDKTYPTIETPSRTPDGYVLPDQSVKVSVNVTDTTSNVKNVTLSYTINDGETWTDLPMNHTVSNLYEATIPQQEAGTTVRLRIVAYDYAGNNRTLDGAEPYCVYQVVPEFPPSLILPLLMILTLLAVIFYRRKHQTLQNHI
jgi:hypothetical protein